MIDPINSDKPISPATARSGESHKSVKPEQSGLPSSAAEKQAETATGTTVEVDQARQLYNLENQVHSPLASTVKTPEAARSLLDTILEQFTSAPEQVFKSQATNVSAPLASLLEKAPA
jgi:hypothetical protein